MFLCHLPNEFCFKLLEWGKVIYVKHTLCSHSRIILIVNLLYRFHSGVWSTCDRYQDPREELPVLSPGEWLQWVWLRELLMKWMWCWGRKLVTPFDLKTAVVQKPFLSKYTTFLKMDTFFDCSFLLLVKEFR